MFEIGKKYKFLMPKNKLLIGEVVLYEKPLLKLKNVIVKDNSAPVIVKIGRGIRDLTDGTIDNYDPKTGLFTATQNEITHKELIINLYSNGFKTAEIV